MELEFSRLSFEKASNMKFQKVRPVGAVVRCGRTDRHTDRRTDRQTNRHDEGTSRLSQLCERA